jgi:hypothetical protein
VAIIPAHRRGGQARFGRACSVYPIAARRQAVGVQVVGRFDIASAGYRLAEVAGFHLPLVDPVGVGDAADPVVVVVVVVVHLHDGVLLTQGTQVQVALQQPQQLPAVGLQVVLELVVGPPTRLGAAERVGERIEGGTGGTKGVLGQLGQQGSSSSACIGLFLARFGSSTPEPTRKGPLRVVTRPNPVAKSHHAA